MMSNETSNLILTTSAPEPTIPLNRLNELLNSSNWVINNSLFKVVLMIFLVLIVAVLIRFVLRQLAKKITSKTKNTLDDELLNLSIKPIFYSVLLLGSLLIFSLVGLDEKSLISKLITSIFWLMWGSFSLKTSRIILKYFAKHTDKQKIIRSQTLPLFANLSLIIICVVFFYFLLAVWGVDIDALVASMGILGLAVGFAAKDTLANLFSGIFILIDQPYKLNDFVVLDTGERGKVTHIGIRSTRILTRDDVEITVPNAIMGNTKIINESGGPYKKYRIKVPIGVAYGTSVSEVRQLLLSVANSNQGVCKEPEARVRFLAFGASSLDLALLCWVAHPELRGRILDQLNEGIYMSFIKHKIEIPYQKRDIYIKEFSDTKNFSK